MLSSRRALQLAALLASASCVAQQSNVPSAPEIPGVLAKGPAGR